MFVALPTVPSPLPSPASRARLTGRHAADSGETRHFDVADTTRATIVGTSATDTFRLDDGRDIDASLRLGYVCAPRTLIYAKAGWANSQARVQLARKVGTTVTTTRVTATDDGLRFGGGIEQLLGDHAYAKAEYRYTSYGEGVDRHQALVGVGYRF